MRELGRVGSPHGSRTARGGAPHSPIEWIVLHRSAPGSLVWVLFRLAPQPSYNAMLDAQKDPDMKEEAVICIEGARWVKLRAWWWTARVGRGWLWMQWLHGWMNHGWMDGSATGSSRTQESLPQQQHSSPAPPNRIKGGREPATY